jgi:hypothetical protein
LDIITLSYDTMAKIYVNKSDYQHFITDIEGIIKFEKKYIQVLNYCKQINLLSIVLLNI